MIGTSSAWSSPTRSGTSGCAWPHQLTYAARNVGHPAVAPDVLDAKAVDPRGAAAAGSTDASARDCPPASRQRCGTLALPPKIRTPTVRNPTRDAVASLRRRRDEPFLALGV